MILLRNWLAPFRGLKILKENKSLRPLVLAPLSLNLAVTCMAFLATWQLSSTFPLHIPSPEASLVWLKAFALALYHFLLLCLGFLLVYMFLFSLLCSIFYQWMVEKVERHLGLADPKSRPIHLQILDSLGVSLLLLAGGVLIFALNLIPVFGWLTSFIAAFVFQSFCIGFEFFDFSLNLRGLSFKEKMLWCRQHIFSVIGVGNSALPFFLVPVLNSCLITLCILGATAEIRHLESQEKKVPEGA